jgi:ABC-type sugar transport system ATPase subunit
VTAPLLEMHGIVKQFPGVRALDGVDLDVRAGEVHCLLGQNGAGKSTLIKVLAGAHQPDAGTISWRGEQVALSGPQAALSRGIATIYQELDLVPGLSVADNIFLGRERSRFGIARPAAANKAAAALLTRLGHPEIRPTAEVGSLSAASQQMVRPPSSTTRRSSGSSRSSATSPGTTSPSSTSPTASRRSARSATASPCSRTAARSPRGCRPARRRRATSSRS